MKYQIIIMVLLFLSFSLLGLHGCVKMHKRAQQRKANQDMAIKKCSESGGLAVFDWSGELMIDCKYFDGDKK